MWNTVYVRVIIYNNTCKDIDDFWAYFKILAFYSTIEK